MGASDVKVKIMYKYDLHVHSRYSGDNDSDPEDIIEFAIEADLDGIAFTEHYSYEASEYVIALQEKYKKWISIIRGIEFSAREGHCLVFGVNTDRVLEKGSRIEEVIERINSLGGIAVPAHPYRGAEGIGDRVFKLSGLTAIEGYNGCNIHAFNQHSIEAATKLGICFTGGSDAHLPSDVGSCYTIFKEQASQDNIVELLKNGGFTGFDNRRISRLTNFFNR